MCPVKVDVIRVGRGVVPVTCTDDTEHLVAIRGGHGAEDMVEVAMRALCARARARARRRMHAWRSPAAARPRARTSDVRGGDGRAGER